MNTPKLSISEGLWLQDHQHVYGLFKDYTLIEMMNDLTPWNPSNISARMIAHMIRRNNIKLNNKWVRAMAIRFARETGTCPFEFRGA